MTRREQMVDRVTRLLRDEGAGKAWSENAAAEVIDAILPQVSTVEELEALPSEAVVVSTQEGFVWVKLSGPDSWLAPGWRPES